MSENNPDNKTEDKEIKGPEGGEAKTDETEPKQDETPETSDLHKSLDEFKWEGEGFDEGAISELKALAKEHNVSADFLKKINELENGLIEKAKQSIEARNSAEVKAANEALEKEWGDKKDFNTMQAQEFYKKMVYALGDAGASLNNKLKEKGLLNDPAFIRMFYYIGSVTADDTLTDVSKKAGGGDPKKFRFGDGFEEEYNVK